MEGKGIRTWLSFMVVAVATLAPRVGSRPTVSLQLVHVDTLSRNSTSTTESILRLRLQREAARIFESPLTSDYLSRVAIGTPPQYIDKIYIDPGSKILWLQANSNFNATKSTSFHWVDCGSPLCASHGHDPSCMQNKRCPYMVFSSHHLGDFATETLTFGETKVSPVELGYGDDMNNLLPGFSASGVLGLGRGNRSFLTLFDSKTYSYCLRDNLSSSNSSMRLGESIPNEAVFTPLASYDNSDAIVNTYYYVNLTKISVDGIPLDGIDASFFMLDLTNQRGGTIVDLGTVVTRLVEPAYSALRDAFLSKVTGRIAPPALDVFDTCFEEIDDKLPTVALHFEGGANMTLTSSNLLIPVDDNGTQCFAFAPNHGFPYSALIGNIQQQGFRMVFDLQTERLGFLPQAC